MCGELSERTKLSMFLIVNAILVILVTYHAVESHRRFIEKVEITISTSKSIEDLDRNLRESGIDHVIDKDGKRVEILRGRKHYSYEFVNKEV